MAKWTIIRNEAQIYKDGEAYNDAGISWLPSDVQAVQSADGSSCFLEKDSGQEYIADTSTLSWWASVETSWQAAKTAWENEQPGGAE